MRKLDKSYITLFDFFLAKFPALFTPIYKHLYKRLFPERKLKNLISDSSEFIGALQPLADIVKDVVDVTKPYRSWWYAERDLWQPIYGIGNLLKGIVYLIAALPILVGMLIELAITSNDRESFAEDAAAFCLLSLSWLVDGLSSLIRGAEQLVLAPLAYLFKMTIRAAVTAYYYFNSDPEKKAFLLAENRPGIQTLVKEIRQDQDAVDTEDLTKIHEKYVKAVTKRDEVSGIKNEQQLYANILDPSGKAAYLAVFRREPNNLLDAADKPRHVGSEETIFKY